MFCNFLKLPGDGTASFGNIWSLIKMWKFELSKIYLIKAI